MLEFFDPVAAKQLRDWAKAVFDKKEILSLIEMFSCELKSTIDICKKWIDQKFTGRYIVLEGESNLVAENQVFSLPF